LRFGNALAHLRQAGPETGGEEEIAKAQAAAARIRELRRGVTVDRPAGMSLREYAPWE
jgi:hypothetical protein